MVAQVEFGPEGNLDFYLENYHTTGTRVFLKYYATADESGLHMTRLEREPRSTQQENFF